MPENQMRRLKRSGNKNNAGESEYANDARRSVEAELAQIAGLELAVSRNPVHHLIEHSRSLFDAIGKNNAEKMSTEKSREKKDGEEVNTDKDKDKETEEDNGFYKRFSEIAFTKGKMLCAVEQNGGKVMMTSCIKRTIDQSPHDDSRQGKVRESGATRINLPDSRAKLSYHRYTRAALELVVDTAQNLTRTLALYERMAAGEADGRLGLPEIDTAYRMYPFLNINREKEKLAKYKEEMKSLPEDSAKKSALNFGVNKLNSVIAHKNHARREFYVQLRKIIANAEAAAKLFSSPETEEEIVEDILKSAGIGEDGGGDESDNTENNTDNADDINHTGENL